MRDLVKTLEDLVVCGIRVTLVAVEGFDFSVHAADDSTIHQYKHVERASELADAIHAQVLQDYPHSLYVSMHASQLTNQADKDPIFPTKGIFPDANEQVGASIQILAGAVGMRTGHVSVVMLKAPIAALNYQGEDILAPTIQMPSRQAMEIGMNLIWVAKCEERNALERGNG